MVRGYFIKIVWKCYYKIYSRYVAHVFWVVPRFTFQRHAFLTFKDPNSTFFWGRMMLRLRSHDSQDICLHVWVITYAFMCTITELCIIQYTHVWENVYGFKIVIYRHKIPCLRGHYLI